MTDNGKSNSDYEGFGDLHVARDASALEETPAAFVDVDDPQLVVGTVARSISWLEAMRALNARGVPATEKRKELVTGNTR